VQVIESAVTRAPGRVTLAVSERTPTVSTVSGDWRAARAQDPDFAAVSWDRSFTVSATTLDALIAGHGWPSFIKIDVEGAELEVLLGLSQPVPAVSFEFLPAALEAAEHCCERLAALGPYRFNWSMAESGRLAAAEWMDGPSLIRGLRQLAPARHGDIYARLAGRE
jgi:hypothetical protein